MILDIFKQFLLMLGLALVQALAINNIHLFSVATPLLYIWIPLHFIQGHPRWSAMMWCFCTGLIIDVFSNTPGLASFSMTLIGLLQPYILPLFVPHDEDEAITPSVKTLGFSKFAFYCFIIIFIYCLVFFSLEMFTFFDPILWLEYVGGSTLLTFLLIVAIEKIR